MSETKEQENPLSKLSDETLHDLVAMETAVNTPNQNTPPASVGSICCLGCCGTVVAVIVMCVIVVLITQVGLFNTIEGEWKITWKPDSAGEGEETEGEGYSCSWKGNEEDAGGKDNFRDNCCEKMFGKCLKDVNLFLIYMSPFIVVMGGWALWLNWKALPRECGGGGGWGAPPGNPTYGLDRMERTEREREVQQSQRQYDLPQGLRWDGMRNEVVPDFSPPTYYNSSSAII